MGIKLPPEEVFNLAVQDAGFPMPLRENDIIPGRKWRFDFTWPDRMIAVEVQGGTWSRGRHTRGAGYENDCEKLNAAAADGWTVLYATTQMVEDGRALDALHAAWIARASGFSEAIKQLVAIEGNKCVVCNAKYPLNVYRLIWGIALTEETAGVIDGKPELLALLCSNCLSGPYGVLDSAKARQMLMENKRHCWLTMDDALNEIDKLVKTELTWEALGYA